MIKGMIRIQAFQKPISNAGVNDMIVTSSLITYRPIEVQAIKDRPILTEIIPRMKDMGPRVNANLVENLSA